MKCPFCEGDLTSIQIENNDGEYEDVQRCTSCGGFWVKNEPREGFAADAVAKIDKPQQNYSLNAYNLACPVDKNLLLASEFDAIPTGVKYWKCNDCGGLFYPKGQLALLTEYEEKTRRANPFLGMTKSQITSMVMLFLIGSASFVGAMQTISGFEFHAAEITTTLTNTTPNLITLIMLGLAYLAGTILAVLGRHRQMIYLGWAIILICLTGFGLIVFGP